MKEENQPRIIIEKTRGTAYSPSTIYEWNGKRQSLQAWAFGYGVKFQTLVYRLSTGNMRFVPALTKPVPPVYEAATALNL